MYRRENLKYAIETIHKILEDYEVELSEYAGELELPMERAEERLINLLDRYDRTKPSFSQYMRIMSDYGKTPVYWHILATPVMFPVYLITSIVLMLIDRKDKRIKLVKEKL